MTEQTERSLLNSVRRRVGRVERRLAGHDAPMPPTLEGVEDQLEDVERRTTAVEGRVENLEAKANGAK